MPRVSTILDGMFSSDWDTGTLMAQAIQLAALELWQHSYTVLGDYQAMVDSNLEEWIRVVRERENEKMQFGSAVHRVCHMLHRGEDWRDHPDCLDERVRDAVHDYELWFTTSVEKVIFCEKTVWGKLLDGKGWTGSPDCVGILRPGSLVHKTPAGRKQETISERSLAIWDIKAGTSVMPKYRLQLGGYSASEEVDAVRGEFPDTTLFTWRIDPTGLRKHELRRYHAGTAEGDWLRIVQVWYNMHPPSGWRVPKPETV